MGAFELVGCSKRWAAVQLALLHLFLVTVDSTLCGAHHACDVRPTRCAGITSNRGNLSDKSALGVDSEATRRFRLWSSKYGEAWRATTKDDQERTRRLEAIRSGLSPQDLELFTYVNNKVHILDAFIERMASATPLWRPRHSLLDVGCGINVLGAYLGVAYGLDVVGYDVPFTGQCSLFLDSPLVVNFFWKRIPEPAMSFDAVSFMNMLHHAANHTFSLLTQAAEISRRWILVTEDVMLPNNRGELRTHDPQGIFRTDAQWKALFAGCCPAFRLKDSGAVRMKYGFGNVFVGVDPAMHHPHLRYYALERRRAA